MDLFNGELDVKQLSTEGGRIVVNTSTTPNMLTMSYGFQLFDYEEKTELPKREPQKWQGKGKRKMRRNKH